MGMGPAFPLATGKDMLSPSSYWLHLRYSYNSRDVIGQEETDLGSLDSLPPPHLHSLSDSRTVSVEPEQLEKKISAQSAGCHETASLSKGPWQVGSALIWGKSAKR